MARDRLGAGSALATVLLIIGCSDEGPRQGSADGAVDASISDGSPPADGRPRDGQPPTEAGRDSATDGLSGDGAGVSARCDPLPAPGGTPVSANSESALRSAVSGATDGTTILVAAGTYTMQNYLHLDTTGLTLRGATGNRDDVILDFGGMSGGHFGVLLTADDVTIADLTIRNAKDHGVSIQGNDRPLLHNLHIVDIGDQLVKVNPDGDGSHNGLLACSLLEYSSHCVDSYTNGISAHKTTDWVVRDNTWRRIRGPGDGTTGPAILFWNGSRGTVVERNHLVDCFRGISFGDSSGAGTDHIGGVVRNNMIYAGERHDSVIEMVRAENFLVAHNTALLLDPAPGLSWSMEARFAEATGTFARNLTNLMIWHDRDGGGGTLDANISTAQTSWFVDAAQGLLHLSPAATAAIDQATALPEVVDDFDGQGRPRGAGVDIGADER